MKQNLLTISIDSDKLKKFPEKFNFLNFFSKKINSRLICGAIALSAAFFIPVSTALAGHKPAEPQIDCTRLQFITEPADPLYEQCVSASAAGNAAASLELARLYLNGGGSIEKNSAEGVRMMKIAGQQGSDTAVLELGLLYLNGEHVEKNVKTAQEYFSRISGVNGQAAMMLAEIKMSEAYELSYGSGKVRRNERRALELYRQVAGSPNVYRQAAQLALGDMYLNGRGTMVDFTEAFRWFNLALPDQESINPENQNVAVLKATMYRKGMGVKQNYSKAQKIYQLLIDRYRNPAAMFELAGMYSYGIGVKQDLQKAMDLYSEVQGIACADFVKISGYPNMCALVGYEIANIARFRASLEQNNIPE